MKNFKNYVPHILAILGFVVVALAYFYPVLSGKQIFQSDIVQYTGMAKELNDFVDQNAIPIVALFTLVIALLEVYQTKSFSAAFDLSSHLLTILIVMKLMVDRK